jgi:osmotically-inducible protein OsmY
MSLGSILLMRTPEGDVTITGLARDADEISRVTRLVSDLPGVNDVKNEMTVTDFNTD